jgi:hypothetical protein
VLANPLSWPIKTSFAGIILMGAAAHLITDASAA